MVVAESLVGSGQDLLGHSNSVCQIVIAVHQDLGLDNWDKTIDLVEIRMVMHHPSVLLMWLLQKSTTSYYYYYCCYCNKTNSLWPHTWQICA
jgi:hypothetical protein